MLVFLLASACSHDEGQTGGDGDVDYYTCTCIPRSVHDPHGKMPICSMDLVPVLRKQAQDSGMTATPTRPDNQTASPCRGATAVDRVTYATVEKKMLEVTLRTVGTVTYDKLRALGLCQPHRRLCCKSWKFRPA